MRCRHCLYAAIFIALVLAALGFFSRAEAATLSWTDNATNESGVHIERAPAACAPVPTTFAKVGEVGPNVVTWVDTGPTPGNRYCYRVRAWNLAVSTDPQSAQYSGWSNLADYVLPFPVPGAPTGLSTGP